MEGDRNEMNHGAMQACIDHCLACSEVCWRMSTTHCLQLGGEHAAQPHLALMLNCAELCRTSAQFMLSGVAMHRYVCDACAKVCAACADDCEAIGQMDDCVAACRRCADSCAAMAA